MRKKNIKIVVYLLVCLCACSSVVRIKGAENIDSLSSKNQILNTAISAMNVDACAIMLDGQIVCVLEDETAANTVLDKFYWENIKCNKNEVLVDADWSDKPDIINIKENYFNILNQEDAVKLLLKNINDSNNNAKNIKEKDEKSQTINTSIVCLKYVKEAELLTHTTTIEYSQTLYQNQQQIKQKGIDGVIENIYKVEYINNIEQNRELIKTKTAVAPQDEIIVKGTKIREQPEYVLPTSGFVSSEYGNRNGEMHLGIDIANSMNTAIVAVKDGIVMRAEWYYGYGKCIDIKHDDGSWSRYGHLNKYLVKVGDCVKQGQEIALMGTTGKSTGPHLHFEIRYGSWPYGRTINPRKILTLSELHL
jgi:murein DD-endopeptidase MepM/ murein hydrolase activator NlpD